MSIIWKNGVNSEVIYPTTYWVEKKAASPTYKIVVVSFIALLLTQDKGAEEQWDKLLCEKAFVRAKEIAWR